MPEFFWKYVELGIEKNIPVMLPAGHFHFASMEQPPELIEFVLNSGAIEAVGMRDCR